MHKFTLAFLSSAIAAAGVVSANQKTTNVFIEDAPSAYITPDNVTLHRYQLDQIPAQWDIHNVGKLSLEQNIYRAGKTGIRWDWKNGSLLDMELSKELKSLLVTDHMQVSFGGGAGFSLWIYNETPLKGEKLTISVAANGHHKAVDFDLGYAGWRAATIQFAEMPDGGDAPNGKLRIQAPKSLQEGWFVLDRMAVGRLTHHTMADYQLPYSKNSNHWVASYHWEQLPKQSADPNPDQKLFDSLATIADNIILNNDGWNQFFDARLSKEHRGLLIDRITTPEVKAIAGKNRSLVETEFRNLNLDSKPVNLATPYAMAKVTYENEVIWRDIEDKLLPAITLDYLYYQDNEAEQRVIALLDWMRDQGMVAGHSFESLSHTGYRTRNLAMSLLYLRDLLAKNDRLNDWTETLKWLTGFAEVYENKTITGGVGDDGTKVVSRLICVLLQDNTPEKVRDAEQYVQWLDNVLAPSNGTTGIVKPDYSFYHHAITLGGYWRTNMVQFIPVLQALKGTEFLQASTWENVRQNYIVYNRIFPGAAEPFHFRGRFFEHQNDFRMPDATRIMALSGNPATGEAVDKELASLWLKNRRVDDVIPEAFKGIAVEDRYHQVLNWAGISTHTIPGASATVMGINNNLVNWDPGLARNYARYNRAGSLYIYGDVKPEKLSTGDYGYREEGYDWSRTPGVTAVYLNNDELKEATLGTNSYGDERSFAGGATLNDDGVYGYRLSETNDKEWNGNKSWFFFGDRIVALGSGLTTADARGDLETTLFQTALLNAPETVVVNEQKMKAFPYRNRLSGKMTLQDPHGHGYYIPASNDSVEIRKHSQRNGNQMGKTHSGDFSVAWINHGKTPEDAQYEYMIRLNGPVETPDYTVLQKDEYAHVVRDDRTGKVGYVIFKATDKLAGPLASSSRPGLAMVDGDEVSFTDPDLMTNPGGIITRYNLIFAPASPEREVVLTFADNGQRLVFKTSNALVEQLDRKTRLASGY